jgi:hypothetical protein
MASVVEESDELSEGLLDVILERLLATKKGGRAAQRYVWRLALQRDKAASGRSLGGLRADFSAKKTCVILLPRTGVAENVVNSKRRRVGRTAPWEAATTGFLVVTVRRARLRGLKWMAARARLAMALMQRGEDRLRPSVQRYLTNVIDGTASSSEISDDYHKLIYQAGAARPCPPPPHTHTHTGGGGKLLSFHSIMVRHRT